MSEEEEIRDTLSLLFSDGDVVELRGLGDGGVHSGYFSDFDVLSLRAKAMDAFRDVSGVYVTLNEVNPALLSRRANRMKQRLSRQDATTADADIVRRRWLPIDFDPVRPSGVSSNAEEHAAALVRAEDVAAWLTKRGFPVPVLADSGNGAHLLYRIDLPNDGDSVRLVKACLTVLDTFFSDDVVHCDTANFNAGRIWKLYGTTACKGDSTDARPHRKARIVSAPDSPGVVSDAILRDLAGLVPRSLPDTEPGRRRGSFDLGRWLRSHGLNVLRERPWQGGTLYSLATCPFSSAHTDGAFAIQFSNGAIFAGCHHDSCGGGSQRWQELRAQYEPEWAAARKKNGDTKGQKEEKAPDGQAETMKTNGETAVSSPAPCAPLPEAPEMQECRRRALEILEHGDPLGFILDVFHRDHVGDRTVAECLLMSVASQSVENTSGLHVSISGNSGKGKTHACNAMVRLLPEEYRLTGTVSDKALFYYDDLRPGTVLLFDDVTLSDDMQELLKSATANFREPIKHRTLTRERQLKVCTIPERCVWWLAKVEAIGDDQVMNRMLTVWIDDSSAQDKAVLLHLKNVEAGVVSSVAEDPDVPVCQAMWEILKGVVRRVHIPFARRIYFSAIHNRRNPAMLFDLIKCHALLHGLQRETGTDGSLIATCEDFEYARRLYGEINSDVGGQETKLTRNEAAALKSILRMGLEIFTIRQLQVTLGLSFHQTRRLLFGYSNGRATYTGILDKCPAIGLIDAMVAEDLCGMEIKKREKYFSFDVGMYRDWTTQSDVWLESDDDSSDSGDGGSGDDGPDDDTGQTVDGGSGDGGSGDGGSGDGGSGDGRSDDNTGQTVDDGSGDDGLDDDTGQIGDDGLGDDGSDDDTRHTVDEESGDGRSDDDISHTGDDGSGDDGSDDDTGHTGDDGSGDDGSDDDTGQTGDDGPGDDGPDDDTGQIGDDGGEDPCTIAPSVHQKTGKSARIKDGQNAVCLPNRDNIIDRCTENTGSVHHNPISFSNPVSSLCECVGMGGRVCLSDIGGGARLPEKTQECGSIANQVDNVPLQTCTSRCTDGERGVLVHARCDTVDLKRETSGSKRDLVNLKRETSGPKRETVLPRKTGITFPLPGILDHRSFRRSAVSLGSCDLCGEKAAVYHSGEERASVCEGCYARLIREWNKGEGVK
ncbi:hypothetical protein L0665_01535 [Methanogenium marinum]|uniref:Uncharacterized protein n=1 Tax=Methanogenium marinum TaxID=348610 RepID=A0A9Q4PXN4_9EURY|nr:hypothetical protein [Methanogenium marinum]MDE4907303.1 hypothetical protein [Methanogenium marinum]